jgi:hypothetical protein
VATLAEELAEARELWARDHRPKAEWLSVLGAGLVGAWVANDPQNVVAWAFAAGLVVSLVFYLCALVRAVLYELYQLKVYLGRLEKN